ncbi:methyl-CpG-binding domain-containing protein 5-like [Syzygium oleosum]|uniref:methyl-CpG-binding domain-containing protein 5-like n=1 Tax=Syzygium oleosum TaxID=219896 RepID=UPI0024BA6F70|nr:methyl-CpG-binding domain-containing protein 5-like [Syzygium oleosum]
MKARASAKRSPPPPRRPPPMSTADPESPPGGHVPDPGTPEPDHLAGAAPRDPLLQSGCFIDPADDDAALAPGDREGQNGAAEEAEAAPISSRAPGSADGAATPQRPSSNGGAEAVPPTPENAGSADDPSSRRKTRVVLSETPDWLPAGWYVEDRVRTSGVTAGTRDKYYCDPVSHRVFRSKKEVLYFLETGFSRKKKKMENADANNDVGNSSANKAQAETSGGQRQKKAGRAPPLPPSTFDWKNCPDQVKWVLKDASTNTWIPHINNEEVPESIRKEWAAALEYLKYKSKV